jgi:hypothetical protein
VEEGAHVAGYQGLRRLVDARELRNGEEDVQVAEAHEIPGMHRAVWAVWLMEWQDYGNSLAQIILERTSSSRRKCSTRSCA